MALQFQAGMIVTVALGKAGPMEEREFVLAIEPTREAMRADYIEVVGRLLNHFYSENNALFEPLGYLRYPGIHIYQGKPVGQADPAAQEE